MSDTQNWQINQRTDGRNTWHVDGAGDEIPGTRTAVEDGWEWAIVEIMGHRKHYGRTREVERFGAKMLRVDIPKDGDPVKNGWETVFYSGPAIFSYSLSDEASVMQANKPYELPARYRLTAPAERHEDYDTGKDDEDGEPAF